ncbi:hypothetical protein CSUI_002184 [Cystoisospora suis]|uniref:Uncharacterized protein n=1 Tax=Cystoisospora suis TaxID=483139 RepID=A0A2C6L9T7_9APIC|nr:hypothetical protein CSUI_002184 [Cystoisospora suis]
MNTNQVKRELTDIAEVTMEGEEALRRSKEETMEDTKVDQTVMQKKDQTDLTKKRPAEFSSGFLEKSENKENSCVLFSRRSSLTISSRSTTSGYVGDCEATGGSFYAWSGPSTDDRTSGSEKGEEDETNSHFLRQQRGESSSPELDEEIKDERKQSEVKKILPVATAQLKGELLLSTENRAKQTPSHMTTVQGEESKQLRHGVDTVTKDSDRMSAACLPDTPRCLMPFPRSSLRLKELRKLVRSRSSGDTSSYQVMEPPLPRSSCVPSSLSPPWRTEEKKLLSHHESHSTSDDASLSAEGKHHLIQRGLHESLRYPNHTGDSRRSFSSPCSSLSPHETSLSSAEDGSQPFNSPDDRGACLSKGTDEGHSRLPYERTISSPRPLSPSTSRCTSPSRRLGSLLRRRPSSLSAYSHGVPSPLADNVGSRRSLYAKPELHGTIPCLEDESFLEAANQHHRSVSSPSLALPLSLCPMSPRRLGTTCLNLKTDKETKSDLLLSRYSSRANPSHLSCAYSSRVRTVSSQDCSTTSPALSPISGSPSSASKDMTPSSPCPTFCKRRRGGESFRAKLLLDLHRQRESEEEDFYELTTARHVEEVSRLQREMAELRRELRDKTLLVEASEQELSARTEEAKALTWQAETARERQAKEREQRERLEAKVRDLTERLGEGEKTAKQRSKERDSAWMKKLNEERDTFKAELAALQKEKAELQVSAQRLRDQVMKLKAQARRRSDGYNKEGEATLEKELDQVLHHSHSLPLKREEGDQLQTADKGEEGIIPPFPTEKSVTGGKEKPHEQRNVLYGLLQKHETSRGVVDIPYSCSLPSNTPLLLQSTSMAIEDLETMCLIDDGDAYIVNEETSSDDKQESPSFLASELFLKHTASLFASHTESDEGQSYSHLSSLSSTKSPFAPCSSNDPSSSTKREGESSLSKTLSRSLGPEISRENDGSLIVRSVNTSLLPRIIRAKSLAEEIAECREEERSLLHRCHMEGGIDEKDANSTGPKYSLARGNHQDSKVSMKVESSQAEKNNPGNMVCSGKDEKKASRDTPGGEDAACQKTQLQLMDDVRPPEMKTAGLGEGLVVEPPGTTARGPDRCGNDLLLLSPVNSVSMKDLEKFIDLEQGGTDETVASEGERDAEQLLLNSDRTSEDPEGEQTDSQDTSRNDKTFLFVTIHPENRNEDPPYTSSLLNPPAVNRLAFKYPSLLSSEGQERSPDPPCSSIFSPTNGMGLALNETDSCSSPPPSPPRCPRKVHTLWNILTRRGWNLLFWICPRRRRDSTESFDEDHLSPVDETTALMDSPRESQNLGSDSWV